MFIKFSTDTSNCRLEIGCTDTENEGAEIFSEKMGKGGLLFHMQTVSVGLSL